MATSSTKREIRFFLVAIAFISAFNYYLTWHDIRFNWFLVLTYLNDTIQGWLAWWAMRSIIVYLDRRIPYGDRPLRRIGLQLLFTVPAGLAVIIFLTELTAISVRGRFAPVDFYLFDLFIISVWLLVINAIYIGIHFFSAWRQAEEHRAMVEQLRSEDQRIRAEGYSVKHGKENRRIAFADILAFYAEERYIVLLTRDGRKYFPDRSLDRVEEQLPAEQFFRLNRQYILHRDALIGFRRLNDGKIDVQLKAVEGLPETIQVSRIRAVPFKNWFDPQ